MTDDVRDLLRHALATVAYRTQKSLREAPEGFQDFSAGSGVRTPLEILHHMSNLLSFMIAGFQGVTPTPLEPIGALPGEIERFHGLLHQLADRFEVAPLQEDHLAERLLQGPLADMLTHAGQLTLLRRLHGSPVAPENYFRARIDARNLGPDQPLPSR